MAVITISRGSFSGGKLIAEKLAEDLGYRCIDRDVIVEKAAASGISQDELRDALQKPPTFLDRFKHKKYIYLALIQAALAEEACKGNTIYHGYAGHVLLKGAPVLRVRIIAPLEYRVSMAQQRLKLGRSEVVSYIRKMDHDRQKWTHYLYGFDWADASLYDMVINLEFIDIEEACHIIVTAAKQQRCFEFDARRQTAMDNIARASRVKASVATNPKTADLELEVVADGGEVRIRGKISSTDQVKEVERVAREVDGVTSASLELTPVTPV